MILTDRTQLKKSVERLINDVRVTDMHTHLYPDTFRNLVLWGIDDLLTYHYLVAEYFRYSNMDYADFFKLTKKEKADLIWDNLFIMHSPISEAQRGVLTVLSKLGMDTERRDLDYYRGYFDSLKLEEYVDRVFEISKVKDVVMTNDPFNEYERSAWESIKVRDKRFKSALRVDPLLNDYGKAVMVLNSMGYEVRIDFDECSAKSIRSFLKTWIGKMDALYIAASLPPTFMMPEDSIRARIIEECILPVCSELKIPFAMMIGVNRNVNPELILAGDSVSRADVKAIEYLCRTYTENKFMVTMLSKENQHELSVTARKFRNLMVFGCWWFLNNPGIIREMTSMRIEMLGLSFIPQHSDARVLDQLIYKWDHFRKIIASVLYDKYCDLFDTGWALTDDEVKRDVENLFENNFYNFTGTGR